MLLLRDSVSLDAAPDRVWSWLIGLADHYTEWHPDHLEAEWERGEPTRVGSVLRIVEILGGHKEELRLKLTVVEPPRRFAYRILGVHRAVIAGGAFEIAPVEQGCVFTATLRCRGGRLVARVFRRRLATLRVHMSEEGEQLRRLVAASG